MVNNDSNFKSIELLRCWCMKSLPTVFSDALSYNQQVCLLTKAINDMANTINGLPDYIIELVKELLNQLNLETIVKKVLADLYFLNVKNPPNNMTPAVGDGVTDDTAAIQAMISYLGGKRAYLFFPAGIYSVTGLNVTTNMSLVGFDRYQTTLQLRAGSNKDLLAGDLGACTINDITLDANMPGQTQNCSVFDGNVGNMLVSNVIFKNGYNVLGVDVDGLVQMDNIVFDGVQGNGLIVGGDRVVINNIEFVNNSLNADTLITVSGTNCMMTNLLNTSTCNKVLNITGNNNIIMGVAKGTQTPYTIAGTDNFIDITTQAGHEVIDGNYLHNTNGSVSINCNSSTQNINTDNAIHVVGDDLLTANNSTETINTTKEITANDIHLNPTNPLTYKEPTVLNDYFKSVPFKHENAVYNVLVEGEKDITKAILPTPNFGSKKNINIYGEFKSNLSAYFAQGFCVGGGNIYCFGSNSDGTSSVCHIVNQETGSVTTKIISTSGHFNDATWYNGYVLVVTGGSIVIIYDASINEIQRFETNFVGLYEIAYDAINNKLIVGNAAVLHVYAVNALSFTYLNDINIVTKYTSQGMCCSEGYIMFSSYITPNTFGNAGGDNGGFIEVFDYEGKPITNMYINQLASELEGIDVYDNKILILYQITSEGTNTVWPVYEIPLYDSEYALGNVLDTPGAITTLTVDGTYTGFYVTGSNDKPFVSLRHAVNYAQNLGVRDVTFNISGNHGGVNIFKPINGVWIFNGGNITNISALATSGVLRLIGCTIGNSSINQSIFTMLDTQIRNCTITSSNVCVLAQDCVVQVEVTASRFTGTTGINCTRGDVNITIGGNTFTTTNDVILNSSNMRSIQPLTYTSSGICKIMFNGERISAGSQTFSCAANASTNITVEFESAFSYIPNITLGFKDTTGTVDNYCVSVTSSSTTSFTAKFFNNSSATITNQALYYYAFGR